MRSRLTLWALLGLSCATPAAAQLASQTALVGTVTDSSGSVLPGASVVAVNTGTQDRYEATTNGEGYYNIQFVRTGKYDITVTIDAFQTFKVTGVEVASNQVVRTNAVLKVGGVTESVTVEGTSRVLDTDRATISETIGQKAIVDLPSSGRNVWSLASTTPGVLGGTNSDIGLSFRGAGQREIQNSLSLDGINSSSNLLAATSMRPIADAVTEVQVQTGSTSAEYGSYLGVHINVVTKSGTNAPHGSVFEYFQGDGLDQRGYFENRALPKNPRTAESVRHPDGRPVLHSQALRRAQQDLLHGRVRRGAVEVPDDAVQLGADDADAAGQLLRDRHANPNARHRRRHAESGAELPRQHHPVVDAVSDRVAAAAVLSGAEPAGDLAWCQQPPESERHDGQDRSAHRARRSERREQDPLVGALQLARQLEQQHRRDSCPGHHAATRQPQHAVLLHPHAHADALQRFPDRISPHRLRHAESFLGEQYSGRRVGTGHSRLRRRRQIRQSRTAEHQHQQLQRPRLGRHELVPVRHHVPDVECARV